MIIKFLGNEDVLKEVAKALISEAASFKYVVHEKEIFNEIITEEVNSEWFEMFQRVTEERFGAKVIIRRKEGRLWQTI